MDRRIAAAFNVPAAIEAATADFATTFEYIGLDSEEANRIAGLIIWHLRTVRDVESRLKAANQLILDCEVEGVALPEMLNMKIKGRSEIIFAQVSPYLAGIGGRVIDYGAGNGRVAQLLYDNGNLDIVGYDVVSYPMEGVALPICLFDGYNVPVADSHFKAALLTNVLHHDDDNEKILSELTRIVSADGRIVIIETVPDGSSEAETKADLPRLYLNDLFYNAIFNFGANIPVPGTYETPQGWIDRFARHGWHATVSENLGRDQGIIADTHHLLVFERA